MPITDEEAVILMQLLEKAEGRLPEGSGYVHQSTIGTRLAKQKEGLTTAHEATKAELAAEKAARAEMAAEIKKYNDKNKTADQLAVDQLAAKDVTIATLQKVAEERQQLAEANLGHAREVWLQNRLTQVISESGIAPARLQTALREIGAEQPLEVSGDRLGNFKIEMTADGLPVADPAKSLTAWWKEQKHLHGARAGGMPAPGAGLPPADPPPGDPTVGMTDAQRFRYNLSHPTRR